jgi:hypothetical protein
MEYLRNCANLKDSPYGFEPTCAIIEHIGGDVPPPDKRVQDALKITFILIISMHKDELPQDPDTHHIDTIVDIILHLLQTSEDSESLDSTFTDALTSYMASRAGEKTYAWRRAFARCDPKWLGTLLTKNLAPGRVSIEKTMYIIWVLCMHTAPRLVSFSEETLTIVSTPPHRDFSIAVYLVPVLKLHILTAAAESPSNELESLMDRLGVPNIPSATIIERWEEGHFAILFQFLIKYSTLPIPEHLSSKQMKGTFNFLVGQRPWRYISLSSQTRFATWFINLLESHTMAAHTDIIRIILSWENPLPLDAETFSDPSTRLTLRTALVTYKATINGGDSDSSTFRSVIETRLIGLNSAAAGENPHGSDNCTANNNNMPRLDTDVSGLPSTSTSSRSSEYD